MNVIMPSGNPPITSLLLWTNIECGLCVPAGYWGWRESSCGVAYIRQISILHIQGDSRFNLSISLSSSIIIIITSGIEK